MSEQRIDAVVDVLNRAIERIRSGKLTIEAQVKQAVIVPIIRALGWDDTNPDEFVPEHPILNSAQRVDYALFGADGHPRVFIEAKKLGNADEKGEEQLFYYAFRQGVHFLILTDGDAWNFYFSIGGGPLANRPFYRVSLKDANEIVKVAHNFVQFLDKARVLSGDAFKSAEQKQTSNQDKEKVKKELPGIWIDLLKEPDSDLRDVLRAAVERKCETEPDVDDLDAFLQSQSVAPSPSRPAHPPPSPVDLGQHGPRKAPVPTSSNPKIVGYILDGEDHYIGKANHTLVAIVNEFSMRDPQFMYKFASNTVGGTRRLVAQRREDLYDKSDLMKYSVQLKNGWWLGTNLSVVQSEKNIQIACEVAGIEFGSRLILKYSNRP